MRLKLALAPATTQMLTHVTIVFVGAFGTALVTGVTTGVSVPTLLALLWSSAAAGLVAVAHYLLGLVPTTPVSSVDVARVNPRLGVALPMWLEGRPEQVLVSVLTTFLGIFGAALVAGAAGVTSLPSVTDLIMAAISAGIAGVLQYVTGLLPAPTT